jgi:hypothetical protein
MLGGACPLLPTYLSSSITRVDEHAAEIESTLLVILSVSEE